MEIKICHIYPDAMNLYGDRGNVLCMKQRLVRRGIQCTVTEMPVGSSEGFSECDLFFIGGGQDFDSSLVNDLMQIKADGIRAAIEDGKTFLCICGGYQMMGSHYETADGEKLEFIGIADFYTKASGGRLAGDYAFTTAAAEGETTVIGFENHLGKTYLGPGTQPLGRVIKGFGNNGEDGTEGLRFKNLFGTYCHGPALPKNPAFCDEILRCAIERKYGSADLEPLDDGFENTAHDTMLARLTAGR